MHITHAQGNDHLLRVHKGSDVEVFLSYFKPLCGHLIGTTPNIEVRPPLATRGFFDSLLTSIPLAAGQPEVQLQSYTLYAGPVAIRQLAFFHR